MAVSRGCLGIVKVKDAAATATGAARIFRIRDWSFSETADRIESSEIGDCTKTFVAGAVETSVNINAWWDTTATANQDDMTVANDVFIEIYPAGSGSGNTYYKTPTAGANLQELSRSGSTDGIVETSWALTVNGALTATSVP